MAGITIQLTSASKALDFHRNDAEVIGIIKGHDDYINVDHIMHVGSIADEARITLIGGQSIIFKYTDVDAIGAVVAFADAEAVTDAILVLLGW